MAPPAALGTPCLVPVQVTGAADQKLRGFITRLASQTLTVSTDPELPVGSPVDLRFKRPTDNELVEITGDVSRLIPEGGLWRGRPAALVRLHLALGPEYFDEEDLRGAPDTQQARRGSEADISRGGGPGLAGALRTSGLGRRRRSAAGSPPPSGNFLAPTATDEQPVPEAAWFAPSADESEDDVTAPPAHERTADDFGDTVIDIESGDAHPAVEDELAATVPPDHSDFTGRFGVFSDADHAGLPPGLHSDSSPAILDEAPPRRVTGEQFVERPLSTKSGYFNVSGEVPKPAFSVDEEDLPHVDFVDLLTTGDQPPVGAAVEEDEASTLPKVQSLPLERPLHEDRPAAPSWQPAPTPRRIPIPAHAAPPVQSEPPPIHHSEPSRTRAAAPPFRPAPPPGPARTRQGPSKAAPAPPSPHNASAPWELESDFHRHSLIPRNARIQSALPVTFWARGRAHEAEARNFSKEGLFLGIAGEPPVRGAVVRVEFPIEGDGGMVPVRFTAEVRWHAEDRPAGDFPEGFGVQILTFETPRDRSRYDELLLLLLRGQRSGHEGPRVDTTHDELENSGFQWS